MVAIKVGLVALGTCIVVLLMYTLISEEVFVFSQQTIFDEPPLVNTYNVGDEVPSEYFKPVLSPQNDLALHKMLTFILELLEDRDIPVWPIFGTLLSSVRNGVTLMPWDDDVDLAIPVDMVPQLLEGLEELGDECVSFCALCTDAIKWKSWLPGGRLWWYPWTRCNAYRLSDEYYLMRKKWGVGLKISSHRYSLDIDIYEYRQDGSLITLPDQMLRAGHIFHFEVSALDVFPLQPIEVPFSGDDDTRDPVKFQIPAFSRQLLREMYGEQALTRCRTSHNHHGTKFTAVEFDCRSLPIRYYRPLEVW